MLTNAMLLEAWEKLKNHHPKDDPRPINLLHLWPVALVVAHPDDRDWLIAHGAGIIHATSLSSSGYGYRDSRDQWKIKPVLFSQDIPRGRLFFIKETEERNQ